MQAKYATTLEDKPASLPSNFKWDWVATDFQTVNGTSKADYMNSGSLNFISLKGGGGNDTLIARGDNCTLEGGAGNDLLIHTGGMSYLDGGAGNDRIFGSGLDNVGGGKGNDFIGVSDQMTISGQAGNDTFSLLKGVGDIDATIADFTFNRREKDVIDFSGLGTKDIVDNGDGTFTVTHSAPKLAEMNLIADFDLGLDVLSFSRGGETHQVTVWGLHDISGSVAALEQRGAIELGDDWSAVVSADDLPLLGVAAPDGLIDYGAMG